MRNLIISLMVVVMVGGMAFAQVQPAAAGKKTVGVGEVKILPSLQSAVAGKGKAASLGRVAESLTGQLMHHLNETGKLTVVARDDLGALLMEQGFSASGNVDALDAFIAKPGKIRGLQYLAVPRIDDFQDQVETLRSDALGRSSVRRTVRLSVICFLYDSSTGQMTSTNFQVQEIATSMQPDNIKSDADPTEGALITISRKMASFVANRIIDMAWPAKVLMRDGAQVTINRGDGTAVAVGQMWEVRGEEMELVDPDTGQKLKAPGRLVGRVRITAVFPQVAQGQILDESAPGSVGVGCVLMPPAGMGVEMFPSDAPASEPTPQNPVQPAPANQ